MAAVVVAEEVSVVVVVAGVHADKQGAGGACVELVHSGIDLPQSPVLAHCF